MIKHGEPNPLSIFGLRQITHCPPHFIKIPFDLKTHEKKITDWIWENLEGRFWIGDHYYTDENNKIFMQKAMAFEQHSEASYISLFLDKINCWDHEIS
jgi:hypothetical protein